MRVAMSSVAPCRAVFTFISLSSVLILSGCSGGTEPAEAATAKAAMTITTAAVTTATWPRIVAANGPIVAWQEAQISARIGGLPLVEVRVDVGDRVQEGQVLARFDARVVRADLAQARANLAQVEANARLAAANRDRALALSKAQALSKQELEQLETQFDAAQAQKALAEAQVAAQEVRLQDCEVRAVDSGVISSRSASLGQVAQAGTELFRMIRRERLEWQAELTASQVAQVQPNLVAKLTLPDGSTATGRVRQIAPALDAQSRMALAYVDIDAGSAARAEMYASGRIELDRTPALIVPAEAVVLRDGRSSIFRVADDETVTQVAVDIGRRDGDWVEILGNVAEGEIVAVRGAGFLNEGDRVKRIEATAQAAQS